MPTGFRPTLPPPPMIADPAERIRLAVSLKHQGALESAESVLKELAAAPDAPAVALTEYGRFLVETNRPGEAIGILGHSLRLNPDQADAHNDLGAALMAVGRLAESETHFAQAAAMSPEMALIHDNLGNVRYRRQRFAEAIEAFGRTLALEPARPSAHLGMGMSLLASGRLAEGWRHYGRRFDLPDLAGLMPPPPGVPRWHGEPLKGKSIVVIPEQGFGDEIMCVRYAATLRDLGAARVTWLCSGTLKELFQRVKGISETRPKETPGSPDHDYFTYALELPALCGAGVETIPAALPYLREDPAKGRPWKSTFRSPGLHVGLVWKGSPTHKNDARRSIPSLLTLAPLWRVPGVSYVSLQKGTGHIGADTAHLPLKNPGPLLASFSDTAAIVAHLDLVICVDTAVAHLAAALGKPVWVLLPFELIDWRWIEGRDDSPWYPGVMRLFRQGEDEPWESVVERVTRALEAHVAQRQS